MAKLCEGYAVRMIVPEGNRDVQAFDDALPGFGIRKFASGMACYFVKYNVGSKQRRLTLGAVVPGNLAEMRKRASTVLSKARLGQDTVAEKRAAAGKGTTLGQLVPIYLSAREGDLRPRTHRLLSAIRRRRQRPSRVRMLWCAGLDSQRRSLRRARKGRFQAIEKYSLPFEKLSSCFVQAEAFAWLAGLPLAAEWGVIAFALNSIPFIGPFIATVFPTLFA